MTTEIFEKATELNTEIEQLSKKLTELFQLKRIENNGYKVRLSLQFDNTEVFLCDEDFVKPIIKVLIERVEQSINDLTQEFNKL